MFLCRKANRWHNTTFLNYLTICNAEPSTNSEPVRLATYSLYCKKNQIEEYVARNRFHTMVEFTSALREETDRTPELFGTGVIIS